MDNNQSFQLQLNTSAGSTENQRYGIVNVGCNALEVITVISSLSTGPGSMTVAIEGQVPGSTGTYTVIASSAYTTTGTFFIRCATGLTSAANVHANQPLPKDVWVTVTHGTTEPQNAYRIGAVLVNA